MTIATTVELAPELDHHRAELTRHCSRLLGSGFDAEDAVQETMVRAWRGFERFEGRSSVRTWLYHIATNVCRDAMERRRRRPVPVDLFSDEYAGPADVALDTADVAASRESVRVALLVALRLLPPRQRAVLILREVLRWRAAEVAELLHTSTAAVNSALQRARASLAAGDPAHGDRVGGPDDLLHEYVEAFARFDVDRLVALLAADGTVSHTRTPEGSTS